MAIASDSPLALNTFQTTCNSPCTAKKQKKSETALNNSLWKYASNHCITASSPFSMERLRLRQAICLFDPFKWKVTRPASRIYFDKFLAVMRIAWRWARITHQVNMRGSVKHFYDFADLDDNIIFILMQKLAYVFCFHAEIYVVHESSTSIPLTHPARCTATSVFSFHCDNYFYSDCFAANQGGKVRIPVQILPYSWFRFRFPFTACKDVLEAGLQVKANAPQGVGFKCAHCNGEFGSRRAMDCHRRHAKSVGTPCADPRSFKSLSFTGRADMSTGILRQHNAGTLGLSNHTPTPYLFNWMYNSLLFT